MALTSLLMQPANEAMVSIQLSGRKVTATVVKENPKTLWVRVPGKDGKLRIIKRHKEKHLVKP